MQASALKVGVADSTADLEARHRQRSFNLIVGGFAFFEVMYSAARLGLFTCLARNPGSTIGQIGNELDIAPYPLRVLLLACTSLRLLKKEGELYWNEPESALLDGARPGNLLPFLEVYHSLLYKPMSRLHEAVQTGRNAGLDEIPGEGKTLYQKLEGLPRLERVFHDWMSAIGRVSALNDSTLPILDSRLQGVEHLVDYGGGDGTNAIKLCQRYPQLRVTVFDLPKVCEMARANAAKHGLSDRIATVGGDFLVDPLLPNVDAILFSHIFNIYSAEDNCRLLEKSYRALRDGGQLIVFNSVSSDAEDGPLGSVLLSLYFLTLATGRGMVYPLKDYDAWFRSSGFEKVSKLSLPPPNDHAFIIGLK